MPSTVSPGFSSVKYTDMLACAPNAAGRSRDRHRTAAVRARSPVTPRRRRTRSRRSSVCPDSPRRTLFVSTDPGSLENGLADEILRRDQLQPAVLAMNSFRMAVEISGSDSASERQRRGTSVFVGHWRRDFLPAAAGPQALSGAACVRSMSAI
jgi:hypothetical protein